MSPLGKCSKLRCEPEADRPALLLWPDDSDQVFAATVLPAAIARKT
jgi:hypothetical protein